MLSMSSEMLSNSCGIILYASRVPTSPERVEANPRPVVPKLPKMVSRRSPGEIPDRCFGSVFGPKVDLGGPKITKNGALGGPGEVPGEPGGAEKPKLKRRRHEERRP